LTEQRLNTLRTTLRLPARSVATMVSRWRPARMARAGTRTLKRLRLVRLIRLPSSNTSTRRSRDSRTRNDSRAQLRRSPRTPAIVTLGAVRSPAGGVVPALTVVPALAVFVGLVGVRLVP
jgi:hypothetical protein